jgi:hypothetical protein
LNGPEIQHLIENDLRRAVAQAGTPPQPDPIKTTPWIAMSLMQKAIRRGNVDLALRAAATLMQASPERVWRRLGCTAPEDIGAGSLNAVSIATAALGGKKLRATMGGDWAVAHAVICELARSPKCRAADDLLAVTTASPAYARDRDELRDLPIPDLVEIAVGSESIYRRALAVRFALGEDPRALVGIRKRSRQGRCKRNWKGCGPATLLELEAVRQYLAEAICEVLSR